MKKQRFWVLTVLGILLWLGLFWAKQVIPLPTTLDLPFARANAAESPQTTVKARQKAKLKSFNDVVKNTQKLDGLFTLYQDRRKGKLYLEIQPEQLNKNYLCIVTLARGIGDGFLLNGLSLDDFLFRFERTNNRIQFVRPNVNFRVQPSEPLGKRPETSFSDSVLYSLDIASIHPTRKSVLVDLSDLLLAQDDLAQLTQSLPFVVGASYKLDRDKSYFSEAKSFPLNAEIEAVYGFTGTGDDAFFADLPSVPDSRSFNLSLHYSFSQLPENNGYVPRLADDRVGYFITAYKNLSERDRADSFVRYIRRWNLEPTEPSATLSPPKQPLVFWIENTVPPEYREAIRDGILMWNKAFEQAGFKDAIQVKQMPDNANWSPADVRYNSIRWSNSLNADFIGIGPSHTNPLTGQLLDADIVIDANVVRWLKGKYGELTTLNRAARQGMSWCGDDLESKIAMGFVADAEELATEQNTSQRQKLPPFVVKLIEEQDFCLNLTAQHQLGIGSLALANNLTASKGDVEKYVEQYLRYLTAHEVGHTLGLRHNFHGSTLLTPQELNDTSVTRAKGMTGSVMDYVAVNLAPPGVEQGDYYPTIVGPYDRWAIEYGYKPSGQRFPVAERSFLKQIAARSPEPELAYATDEDRRGFRDPEVNIYDLSSDVLVYAQSQMDNARQMWEKLSRSSPSTDEGYSEVRKQFDTIFTYYFKQAILISNYIGGSSFNRDRPGTADSRLPFQPVPAEKQRAALQALQEYVFAQNVFSFPPDLLNQLAPSRWNHWGQRPSTSSLDYPIHESILSLQRSLLRSLLSNQRLSHLRNLELRANAGESLTLPELFDILQAGIWTEVLEPNEDALNISSIRRALQREHLDILTKMVLRRLQVPEDARTLAWYQLNQLGDRLDGMLGRYDGDLDAYTQAHLTETRDRVRKALNAPLQSKQRLGKR